MALVESQNPPGGPACVKMWCSCLKLNLRGTIPCGGRGLPHVEPDIYPCQCVRTCVRAFHSHLAMDCCKHNRLDLRYAFFISFGLCGSRPNQDQAAAARQRLSY